MPHEPPEGDSQAQEATRDEVVSACLALRIGASEEDSKRLLGYAASQLRMRQIPSNHLTEEELVQNAFLAVLSGRRKWFLRREPFISFMFGVILSLARDVRRTKAGKLDKATASLDELRSRLDDGELIPGEMEVDLELPDEILQAKQQFEAFQRDFEDDYAAWCVLECMREKGLSGKETQKHLGISENEFNAARQRIGRRLNKFFFSH